MNNSYYPQVATNLCDMFCHKSITYFEEPKKDITLNEAKFWPSSQHRALALAITQFLRVWPLYILHCAMTMRTEN